MYFFFYSSATKRNLIGNAGNSDIQVRNTFGFHNNKLKILHIYSIQPIISHLMTKEKLNNALAINKMDFIIYVLLHV